MSRFEKKPPRGQSATPGADLPADPVFPSRYPVIWEYLTINRYDSGESRQTATLMLLVEGGQWKACLNDRESTRSLWVAGDAMEGVLGALERALDDPGAAWRVYQAFKKPKR